MDMKHIYVLWRANMQKKHVYVVVYNQGYGESTFTVAAADIVEAIHMVRAYHQIEVEEIVKVSLLCEDIMV